jgi:hypothetical protein
MVTYTIKAVYFLKKDDIMSFSFEAASHEAAVGLVRTLDRFVLASMREDKTVAPGTYDLDVTKVGNEPG